MYNSFDLNPFFSDTYEYVRDALKEVSPEEHDVFCARVDFLISHGDERDLEEYIQRSFDSVNKKIDSNTKISRQYLGTRLLSTH